MNSTLDYIYECDFLLMCILGGVERPRAGVLRNGTFLSRKSNRIIFAVGICIIEEKRSWYFTVSTTATKFSIDSFLTER